MRNKILFGILSFLVFGSLFWACEFHVESTDCPKCKGYRILNLYLVDTDEHPITSATVKLYLNQAQTPLDLVDTTGYSVGRYQIFNDSLVRKIDGTSASLNVHINYKDKPYESIFQLSTNTCLCHFEKSSGPDTLRLR